MPELVCDRLMRDKLGLCTWTAEVQEVGYCVQQTAQSSPDLVRLSTLNVTRQ